MTSLTDRVMYWILGPSSRSREITRPFNHRAQQQATRIGANTNAIKGFLFNLKSDYWQPCFSDRPDLYGWSLSPSLPIRSVECVFKLPVHLVTADDRNVSTPGCFCATLIRSNGRLIRKAIRSHCSECFHTNHAC